MIDQKVREIAAIAQDLSPQRQSGLLAFPSCGVQIRATVFMRWSVFNHLKLLGLIEGETHCAKITNLGKAVQKELLP